MSETIYTSGDLEDHIAVSAVLKDAANRVLMFKHKKFGFWTIPIGKAEPGETAYEGMSTEVAEECGVTVKAAHEAAMKSYSYERNGRAVNLVHHLFVIDKYEGEVMNNEPEKHPEMKFMTEDEIRKTDELSDATLLYLETQEVETA